VLPLNNQPGRHGDRRARLDRYVYHPGIGTLPEAVAPNLRNRAFQVVAEIERTAASVSADGVVIAHGGPQGGYAVYVAGGRLHYVHNLLGSASFTVSASVELPVGSTAARVVFTPTGPFRGDVELFYGDVPVGQGHLPRTTPISFGVEGFSVGYQRGAALTDAYEAPFAISHDVLKRVVIDGIGPAYRDLPGEERAALAQQ
jgi:arylsulfatase